ncbi:MAG: MBOAT family protein [Alphaproteobacteria bacterium]|nr:MBOAT family protein [Alphaproteobacteria bacterium]
MVFSSLEFIYLFLPPVLFGFYVLRALRLESAIIWWLILASVVFYAWWSPPHLLLLFGSVMFNYGVHRLLLRHRSKALFVGGVVVNLGLLAVFKYADFLIGNVNAVANLEMTELGLILPLAISFYTFQQISFLHDTWAARVKPCDFKRYVLFVTFSPQLIAGPIVMQRDTIPQFRLAVFTNRTILNLVLGSTLFFIGLFKKIVLADGVAPVANAAFGLADQGQMLPMTASWLGAVAYTFQIYFDFSGYCDMALGLARIFGIRLPINFNSPYKARSIVEFWHRWHISLSRFLRDYLYIPLGGNRTGILGRHGNLMATMLLGGLWHGAGWNFVLWGALHGSYLIANHVWSASTIGARVRKAVPGFVYSTLSWGLTMIAVIVAWVFFRAETLQGSLIMLQSMVGLSAAASAGWLDMIPNAQMVPPMLAAMLVVVVWLPNGLELTVHYRPVLSAARELVGTRTAWSRIRWSPTPAWSVAIAVVGSMSLIQIYRLNDLTEFIYFNF